jgi:phage-related baseplate assembly protein
MDVRVYSPAPVEVVVLVLMAGGELPTSDILAAVDAVVNVRTVRPLTDQVTVAAPEVVSYDIDLQFWIDSDNEKEAERIINAVGFAVQDFILWQKSKIGRNINPSELTRRIMNAGARRVEITDPVYTVLNETQVAVMSYPSIDIIYGGLEDD